MSHLALHLLGTWHAELNAEPLLGIRTNRARGLLAYLAVEHAQSHPRTRLATLFWPDWPEATARTYLRQALANLRSVLDAGEPPCLQISRQSVRFMLGPGCRVDVAEVTVAAAQVAALPASAYAQAETTLVETAAQAVACHRGPFLEGFYLEDCPEFEEWQLITQERLRRQIVNLLLFLTQWYETHGEIEQALSFVWRCVDLEPLLAESQLLLLQLLAQQGEFAVALAQYARYTRLLANELGARPSSDLEQFAARLRGQTAETNIFARSVAVSVPPFLAERPLVQRAQSFVDRVEALAALDAHLDAALQSDARVVFVAGDAGSGKTLLVEEFIRRSLERCPTLVVAAGGCSGAGEMGDSYLPFREILAQLTGDCADRWRAGRMARDQVLRLWRLLPVAADALLAHSRGLVDTLLSGAELGERLAWLPDGAEWRQRLGEATQAMRSTPVYPEARRDFFDQVTRWLWALAKHQPLLLWLDDLHWADSGSLALFFHLCQRLTGHAVMVVATYRPEEISAAEGREAQTFVVMTEELRLPHHVATVDLDRGDGRAFVRAYLESIPHDFDRTFVDALYAKSSGHALFTVELVQYMQDQGLLVRAPHGYWRAIPALDWGELPARVEAVIGQRLARLPTQLLTLLTAAAIQGEKFTAEVVAHVLGKPADEAIHLLSAELGRRYRLVLAVGVARGEALNLAHYRFRHALFCHYLLNNLDTAEARHLHAATATAMETVYASAPDELAAHAGQLAWHHRESGRDAPAVSYYLQAGNSSLRLGAYSEAERLFVSGLELVVAHPASELDLLLGLGSALVATRGNAASEVEAVLRRALPLCQAPRLWSQRFQVTWHLWHLHFQRGEYAAARTLAQGCVDLVEMHQPHDGQYRLAAAQSLGSTLYRMGEFVAASRCMSAVLPFVRTVGIGELMYQVSLDPGVSCLVNESLVRWYLGKPEQAEHLGQEGVARARQFAQPFSLAFALVFVAALSQRANDSAATATRAAAALAQCQEWGVTLFAGVAALYHGWAAVAQGDFHVGLREAEAGLEDVQATGMQHGRFTAVLADAYVRCGRIDDALVLSHQVLAWSEQSGEREWEAEIHRLQGEIMLLRGQNREAEIDFKRAIGVAQDQQARSLQLRATLSLSRLWQQQGKSRAAYDSLSAVYDRFTEGFDTPDLQEARTFLALLAGEDMSASLLLD